MAFYIKVTKEVADRLHLTDIRNRTADGNVLLWQADVARFPGDTVFDRAKEAGGICLTPCNLQIFLCLFLEKLNMPQNTPVTKAS